MPITATAEQAFIFLKGFTLALMMRTLTRPPGLFICLVVICYQRSQTVEEIISNPCTHSLNYDSRAN